MPEIEAALLALNVHGDANRTVFRERVIQAYRTFIRERPPMAGFVAPQLADWDYWDVTTEYVALPHAGTAPAVPRPVGILQAASVPSLVSLLNSRSSGR